MTQTQWTHNLMESLATIPLVRYPYSEGNITLLYCTCHMVITSCHCSLNKFLSCWINRWEESTGVNCQYLFTSQGQGVLVWYDCVKLLPHCSCNTVLPHVHFIYPNISPLCIIVVIINPSTNWLIHIPTLILIILLMFMATSKVMYGS